MAERRLVIAAEQLRRRVPGGLGTYATGLLNGLVDLAPHGLEVVVAASRGPGDPDPLARRGVTLECSVLPAKPYQVLCDLGVVGFGGPGVDVVHTTALGMGRVRGPSVASILVADLSWRDSGVTTGSRAKRWHERALHRALRRADRFIVLSEPVAEALRAAGAPREAVAVIPCGTDHLPAPDLDAARMLLEEHEVEGPTVLCAATAEPRKNLRRLLEACQQLFGEGRSLTVVLVGPQGWGDAGLNEAHGGVRVVHLGFVEPGTLAGLMVEATVFGYVPVTEGYGLPPVEALSLGTPVVCSTTTPSVAHLAAPGVRRVDPRRPSDIAAALDAVLADPSGARRSVEAQRGDLEQTWAQVAQQHLDAWGIGG